MPFPAEFREVSVLQRANRLETDLQELVEIMQVQRIRTMAKRVVDISSRKGTPSIAPATGKVIKKGYDKYLGKYVKIDHGQDIVSTYGHLSGFNVSPGQKVVRGDVVGFMGSSGLSTGHHLHYMVKIKNRCVNPLHYILNAKANRLLFRPLRVEGGGQ